MMPTHYPKKSASQRGASLVEPLVSIVILSLGVLGLAQYQLRVLAENSDSQARVVAVGLVDEYLTQARLDAANLPCYALPTPEAACGSDAAKTLAAEFLTRAQGAVPGYVGATTQEAGGQFTVRLQWTSRAFKDTRQYEAITDVRN